MALFLQLDSHWKPYFIAFISSLTSLAFSIAIALIITILVHNSIPSHWKLLFMGLISPTITRDSKSFLLSFFDYQCQGSSNHNHVHRYATQKHTALRHKRPRHRTARYNGQKTLSSRRKEYPEPWRLPRKSSTCQPVTG